MMTANARNLVAGSLGMRARNDAGTDLDARKYRIVRRGPVGASASQATLGALADAGTVQRVPKGRTLLVQGDAASSVGFVGMGRVRLLRTIGELRTLAVGYRGAGDLVGEAALGGVDCHRDSAVATEDVDALLVPVATVRALMAADQAFGSAIMATLVDRHAETEERLASMLFRNVESRLAEFLVKAAARWGIPEPRGVLIAAPFTHQEIASMVGSTRETVTLTLGDLRRQGLIQIDRRRIIVVEKDALRAKV